MLISTNYSRNLIRLLKTHFLNYDLLSVRLILLTLWVLILIIISQLARIHQGLLILNIVILTVRLVLTFLVSNIFLFYFLFEISLIPIFLIIMGWGYQPERLKAGIFLFFYTLFASLPLLITIMLLLKYMMSQRLVINLLSRHNFNNYSSVFVYFTLLAAFIVKFPIFIFHAWLPKAHVEAPVSGSIVLAAVLLKLGGYGALRIIVFLSVDWIILLIVSISLVGGGLLRVICMSQRDIKVVIAYSSVVHMALVIAGLLSLSMLGYEGGIIIMLAHGVCSSGIFSAANIIYIRSHSRSYYFNKGILNTRAFFWIIWFLLTMANFGGPFTYNLLGEIILILNLRVLRTPGLTAITILSFFSAAYRLILFSSTQQGQILIGVGNTKLITGDEILILIRHTWPLIFLPLFLVNFYFRLKILKSYNKWALIKFY